MYLECPDLSTNKFVSIYVNFGDETYRMTFKWNDYCNCCFLSFYDSDGNQVNTGNALVDRTVILTDRRKIPTMKFVHKDNINIEPTAETMKDFLLIYENTARK